MVGDLCAPAADASSLASRVIVGGPFAQTGSEFHKNFLHLLTSTDPRHTQSFLRNSTQGMKCLGAKDMLWTLAACSALFP